MELIIDGLNDRTKWEKTGVSLPSYDIRAVSERTKKEPLWVHFGAGNIFRMFIAGLQDTLLNQGEADRGIICAETFGYDIIDEIYTPHDNLVLGVTLNADGTTEKKVIGSLCEAIKSISGETAEWRRLKEIFASHSLQMVSFTITEKGYALYSSDGTFLPSIAKDIEGGLREPKTAMAQVTALLHHRFESSKTPIAVVSMDNCSRNGEKLRAAVLTIATEWQKRGLVSNDFVSWVSDEKTVSFPWTMIDKITPRPNAKIGEMLEKSGIEAMKPTVTKNGTYIAPFVNAEKPQYLVIEDSFPNGRPRLEKAGVYLTDRESVNRVERMKVTTCLNPLHTALAVYGCLLGFDTIADEMKDDTLRTLVEKISAEGLAVVTDPHIISPEKFAKEVLCERLPNPFMPDTPQRIATDTSQKVGIRFGETIKSYIERDGNAKALTAIPLAIAGWLRYLLAIKDDGEAFEPSSDPLLSELQAKLFGIEWGKKESCGDKLKAILSSESIFSVDLYKAGIGEKIEELFLEEIAGVGAVRATLKKHLSLY